MFFGRIGTKHAKFVMLTISSISTAKFGETRHAEEGGRREQASLLPFSWGSRGSRSALFKCNYLFFNC